MTVVGCHQQIGVDNLLAIGIENEQTSLARRPTNDEEKSWRLDDHVGNRRIGDMNDLGICLQPKDLSLVHFNPNCLSMRDGEGARHHAQGETDSYTDCDGEFDHHVVLSRSSAEYR